MDAGKGALALGAIILYAAVRVAADAFYGNFDATAEDAGLTYSSILTRAAIGFVDYVLVLSVAVLGAFVLLDAWRRHKTDSKPILVDAGSVGDNYSDVKRATSLFLIAAGVSVGLYAVGLTWRHPSLMFLGVVLFVAAWIPLSSAVADDDGAGPLSPRIAFGGLVFVVSAITVLVAAAEAGHWSADDVALGRELHRNELLSLLPAVADCVTLSTSRGFPTAVSAKERKKYLYLGRSDGVIVLTLGNPARSDTDDETAIRVPEGDIVTIAVDTNDESSDCFNP